jgi:hypothetical protein
MVTADHSVSTSSWTVDDDEHGSSSCSTTYDELEGQGAKAEDEVEDVQMLTRRETKGVNAWKLTLVLTIFVTALAVSACTYSFLDRQEEQDFERSVSTASAV